MWCRLVVGLAFVLCYFACCALGLRIWVLLACWFVVVVRLIDLWYDCAWCFGWFGFGFG